MSTSEKPTTIITTELREVDGSYKPFPTFKEWNEHRIDLARWDRYTNLLAERRKASPELLEQAQAIVRRAAAVDTGAIEGLYEVDRGFTYTVATEAAFWQATVEKEKGAEVRSLIEAQLNAYEYVMDLATQSASLTEAAIRELHEVTCETQDTFTAYTEVGIQQLPLRKGEYKSSPNHVLGRDGKWHAYAPVDLTPIEMRRLCEELRSKVFAEAHPILQASYAHYAFVLIHPFTDGNGRVARALASIYTYRAQSVPLLILFEKRAEYLDVLASADGGHFQPFIDFVLESTLDSIQLVDDSIRAAASHSVESSLEKIGQLSQTKGGYTHEQVDEAGNNLLKTLMEEFKEQGEPIASRKSENLIFKFGTKGTGVHTIPSGNYRMAQQGADKKLTVSFRVKGIPAQVAVEKAYDFAVPKDSEKDDDIIVRQCYPGNKVQTVFSARASELIPQLSGVTQMRISIFVRGVIREMLDELETKARKALGR